MTIIFILFVVLVVIILLPSQQTAQKNGLADVEESLTVRLEQLKRDFQFRTKELSRRLASGDLAQEEWQKLTDELQLDTRRSIESTTVASDSHKTNSSWLTSVGMLAFIIAIALVSYHFSGAYEQANQQSKIANLLKNDAQTIDKLSAVAQKERTQQSLNDLYLALRTKVELLPSNVYSWRELAHFNANYGRISEAKSAMDIALKIEPNNLDLKIDLAQILSQSQKKQELFASLRLVDEVLKEKPQHEGALLLLGRTTYAFGMYKKAISSWQKLLKRYEPGSEMAIMLEQRINEAEAKLSGKVVDAHPAVQKEIKTAEDSNTTDSKTAGIIVNINIPDAVRSKLNGNENIFIFAKAVDGVKFPLAVVKTSVSELTEAVLLSDANAMRPDVALSKFDNVRVTVRISLSGDVVAKTGDIQGHSDIIRAPYDGKTITLVVDEYIK